MDEGEQDKADAFDPDNHVAVFLDPDDMPGVTGEVSAGDAHMLMLLEIRLIVDLAPGRAFGCEQSQQVDRAFGNRLNRVVLGVAVNPEGYRRFGMLATLFFKFESF